MRLNMSLKESNEITLKIKCELNEFYKILEEKGFKIIDKFSMDDTYFVPEEVNLDKVNTRDILSKAVLVRDIIGKMPDRRAKLITFKIKNFDESGNILNQESVNCNILETEDAKKLLKAIGYKEIMNIKEDDVVYEKDRFQLAIKDIKNGDNLIEIETEENKELNTIEKLIQKVSKIGIPVYTDNYFVKKAEIELDKILSKNTNKEKEKSCGCIIINDDKVLLIKQTKGHWGFPKGHMKKDETEIETAVREVKEETNLDVEIDANKRYTIEYVTDKGNLKQLVLFIAKCIGGEIKAQESEVNDIKWLNFNEAIETITYDNTRELFKKILKEGNYERK